MTNRTLAGVAVVALAAAWTGCGGAQAPAASSPPASSTVDLVSEMESLEGQIAEQEPSISTAALDCESGCRAASSICDCASRICQLAGELGDRDSVSRCRQAETTCSEARQRIDERCTCRDV